MLEAHGHHTTAVPTPHDALVQLAARVVRRGAVQRRFAGAERPGSGGPVCAAELGGRRHLRAVALTDLTRVEDRAAWLHAGFDAVVTRPIRLPELLATLEQLVQPAAATTEHAVYDESIALARVDGDAALSRR